MNRLWLALQAFWRTLTDPEFAARVEPLFQAATTGPDLRILAVLQRDGRLIDFLQEEIDPYTDVQIGAAVRDIHRGCRKARREYLHIEPVMNWALDSGAAGHVGHADFDPSAIRLIGNVNGSPPFQGVLKHHYWLARPVPCNSPHSPPRRTTRRSSPRPKSRSPDIACRLSEPERGGQG